MLVSFLQKYTNLPPSRVFSFITSGLETQNMRSQFVFSTPLGYTLLPLTYFATYWVKFGTHFFIFQQHERISSIP
jgi:hypothetical protein